MANVLSQSLARSTLTMAWHLTRTVPGLLLLGALIYFLGPIANCTCGYDYHFVGTIIDSQTTEPIARARVAVCYFDPGNEKDDLPVSVTNSKGEFEGEFVGAGSWGYQRHVFSLFPPPKGPASPEIKEVFVFVRFPDGKWHALTVGLTPSQQLKTAPAKRWLDLSDISIDTSTPLSEN